MAFNIDTYVNETNEFLKKVARVTSLPEDKGHAYRLVSSFFHALRLRITPDESMHFISQLPMFFKGVYVDGWKFSKQSDRPKTLTGFLDDVRENYGPSPHEDLMEDKKAAILMRNIIGVLRIYLSAGELNDVKKQLPQEIGVLFENIVV